jgi:SAM-dependent methyltransferase
LLWNGKEIPLPDNAVDCAIATELFEHCPEPEVVMQEICRVLKPGGILFLTVPFLWPLHDTPYDEYRYTPFSIERHLHNASFCEIKLAPLGGWDASLAQMIGLWVRRRLKFSRKQKILQAILNPLLFPIVWGLIKIEKPQTSFSDGLMITGIWGTARKSK